MQLHTHGSLLTRDPAEGAGQNSEQIVQPSYLSCPQLLVAQLCVQCTEIREVESITLPLQLCIRRQWKEVRDGRWEGGGGGDDMQRAQS